MPMTTPRNYLPHDRLLDVVRLTPLVSVDLICRNARGEVLLGWRSNRPAQGSWFVPGGRILKDERVAEAIRRIAAAELGLSAHEVAQARALGVFQHLYPDNFAGIEGVSTHYVVLAYEIGIDDGARLAIDNQHRELRWFMPEALCADPSVHLNTRAYFDATLTETRTP
jgi:colanic acid biosynthesis protein WcaH